MLTACQVALPDKMSISSKAPAASLPPSLPSSCTGQSVAEQEVSRSGASDSGEAPTASAPLPLPSLRHASSSAPRKRPAQPKSVSAPRAKRAFTSPFVEFCKEQRPLLPLKTSNRDREKLLGVLAP